MKSNLKFLYVMIISASITLLGSIQLATASSQPDLKTLAHCIMVYEAMVSALDRNCMIESSGLYTNTNGKICATLYKAVENHKVMVSRYRGAIDAGVISEDDAMALASRSKDRLAKAMATRAAQTPVNDPGFSLLSEEFDKCSAISANM